MKRSSLLVTIILALVCFAGAQTAQCKKPVKPTPPPPTPVTTASGSTSSSSSTSSASSSSSSSSGSSSTATGGNATAEGGNSSATTGDSSAVNGGNTVSENYNQVRQAPPAIAPPVLNGVCTGGISAGASAPVGGLSFGKSTADKNCQAMNLAAFLAAYHNYEGAAKTICSSDAAKRAKLKIEDCRLIESQLETSVRVTPPAPAPVIVTPPQSEMKIIYVNPQPTVVEVTPTPAELKEAGIAPKKVIHASTKPAQHKAKPCTVPDSLKHPIAQ